MSQAGETIKAAIVGATSISSGALIKILGRHPNARIELVTSEHLEGGRISQAHPHIRDIDMTFERFDPAEITRRCAVAFITRPHTDAMKYVKQLEGVKVIDFSADFRLRDPGLYPVWYKTEHLCPELLPEAVYGMPELYRDRIRGAELIANPGCYPTSVILGLAPLFKSGLVPGGRVFVDAFSGTSGAGRSKLDSGRALYVDVAQNLIAYKPFDHNHAPEMEQELAALGGEARVSFIPHVAPFRDGIVSNCFFRPEAELAVGDLVRLYREFYADEPFVRIFDDRPPDVLGVVGTNYCDIGFAVDPRHGGVCVMAAVDNLIKGAAGQAVQNMNLVFGLEETAGLS